MTRILISPNSSFPLFSSLLFSSLPRQILPPIAITITIAISIAVKLLSLLSTPHNFYSYATHHKPFPFPRLKIYSNPFLLPFQSHFLDSVYPFAQFHRTSNIGFKTALAFKSYQNQAQVLVKTYLLADAFMPYTSVLGGIFATKMVYDLTQLISTFYFRTYAGLTKIQRIEWNNRGMSSIHAIFIATMSLYFVFWSDLYSDQYTDGPVTFRSSPLSTFALGVSVGYFLSDLGMIFWLYPALGGLEYVVHHTLSAIAVAYAMFTGEGQLYTFMVLISELTTPEINLRWYLDTAGLKKSNAYLINGVVIFFAWMMCSRVSALIDANTDRL
ncbi:TRAM/LAG1/CLN8 homology domain-containing protein [Cynara cardunculus var. scolymus]|uniref:TRAM/LAG1/CLN8 homology domain-containing protein n=1 Tax=Cynara cardunculus var. scolymus TaxID=59895 RepID=A0A118K1P8_CYNCS|nr:TRAM/LAG1/CLN8 homology domain-containing protein [Cynara cardunculus var. scolymus]